MILLDTSFLVAYRNERDVHHAAAAKLMERIRNGEFGPSLLLEYVFLELVTVLQARRGLAAAVAAGRELLAASDVEFVPCSSLFTPILETFRSQSATSWSFADAALVTVAKRRGVEAIATFDRDLARAPGVSTVP